MATVTYKYTNGVGSGWSNISYAFDDTDDTYATKVCNTFSSLTSNDMYGSANDCPGTDLGTITKVEIGYEGYVENLDLDVWLDYDDNDYFNLFYGGTEIDVSESTTDDDTIYWADITTHTNAPATWTWSKIQDAYVGVSASNGTFKNDYTFYVDQVYIRVTYTPAGESPTLFGPNLHYCKTSITASTGNEYLSSDNFNDNSLDTGIWMQTGDTGVNSYSESSQQLTLTSSGTEEDGYIVLAQDTNDEDFDVSVKIVSTDQITLGFTICDLEISASTDFAYIGFQGDDYLVYYINNTPEGESASPPLWVRAALTGTTMVLYKSSNGTDWTQVMSNTYDDTNIWVGLGSYSANAGDSCEVVFDDFVNITDPGGATVTGTYDINCYSTTSGIEEPYFNVQVSGTHCYCDTSTNLSHEYASDLTFRRNGETRTVLTTWSGG